MIHQSESLSTPITLSGKRVLVCDNETLVLMQVKRFFTHLGMDVVGEARSGEEAVRIAESRRPEIILMDLNLPDGAGTEVVRRILKTYSACFLLTSEQGDVETQAEAYEAGACGFVCKPFTCDDLADVLDQALFTFLVLNSA